jgi:hypothetical protein
LNGAQRLNGATRLNVSNNNIHSGHCRACKERVGEILTAIYGMCSVNQQFPWPAHPEKYAAAAIGNSLELIRGALGTWRGHRDFIKSAQVPPCDFFISDPPFILEFDESQHFSWARLITLELYPKTMTLGFSLSHWRSLCREINAQDDKPFDRDERRAWYDVLRDFVPIVYGFKPTVRLYAGAYQWCAFDAASAEQRKLFRRLCEIRPP